MWETTASEIQDVERLLLPDGCHFADDAVQVIRHWNSVDVSACPGSGKTTVLLAKLKLLADKMPLENGAGICVLSHTNIAINEIKSKLAGYADKLMGYPNYIGTIQTFIDRFVTIPYIRRKVGRIVQPLDDKTYAQHMLHKMSDKSKYGSLFYIVTKNYENGGSHYSDRIEHTKALYLREDGALCIGSQRTPLAGSSKPSANQFLNLINDLLINEGIIRYYDAFRYAADAVDELSNQYTDLFSRRFKYVFIDEYQDCSEIQRNALNKLFDLSKCVVFHIGDADQAIYNSGNDKTVDWCPNEGALPISLSRRYVQEIADVLSPLRKNKESIISAMGEAGQKPVLIIYDKASIERVLY